MSKRTETDRHPIRSLIKLVIFAGLITLVVRTVAAKKKEFIGLTESEAREKFTNKLGSRIGEERATEVIDQIIPKLMERGFVIDDPVASDETTASDDQDSGNDSDG